MTLTPKQHIYTYEREIVRFRWYSDSWKLVWGNWIGQVGHTYEMWQLLLITFKLPKLKIFTLLFYQPLHWLAQTGEWTLLGLFGRQDKEFIVKCYQNYPAGWLCKIFCQIIGQLAPALFHSIQLCSASATFAKIHLLKLSPIERLFWGRPFLY